MKSITINNDLISLTGIIASDFTENHIMYNEKFYTFMITSPRLSGIDDTLPVVISEKLLTLIDFKIGNVIHIIGQIRSRNKFNVEKQRSELLIFIFVDKIKNIDNNSTHTHIIKVDGTICRNVNCRTTPFGRTISDLLLAVNSLHNKSYYLPCIAWGRNAIYTSTLQIGDSISINGRLQSRPYVKTIGNISYDRIAYEISIRELKLLNYKGADMNESV